jgi:uncharacterized protein
MEIRDPVHGSISILDQQIPIIENPFFGRLRNIKQLGFSEYVFPGATHTRFIHSIGTMSIGERVFTKVFEKKGHEFTPFLKHDPHGKKIIRLKETFKLACLLHDIGHAPLSHSTEIVMPEKSALNLPIEFNKEMKGEEKTRGKIQATHEDYTIKAIVDSTLTSSFKESHNRFGVEEICVAELIKGQTHNPDYFTLDGICYFPFLHQLVSSELDCDRMDYLLRDSYFCGVNYGKFDLEWLLENIRPALIGDQVYLGISERAVITFDDFLLSRYHMFVMVYFHYRAVCLEQLLIKFFHSSPLEYEIPSSIDEYQDHDDHYLMKVLRKSSNKFAKSIVKNQIPKKIFESFNTPQHIRLDKIKDYLESEGLDFIKCSSSGRLSKYYQEEKDREHFPIKVVRRDYLDENIKFFDIDKATKLFQKFKKSHSINRLHVHMEDLSAVQRDQIMKIISS